MASIDTNKGKQMLKTLGSKRVRVVLFGLLLLALVATAALLVYRYADKDSGADTTLEEEYIAVCARAENEELISSALLAFEAKDQTENERITTEISNLEGYETDPNCLYIITWLKIRNSDAAGAEEALAKLKLVYVSDQAIEDRFGFYAYTLDSLATDIENVKFQQEAAKQSVRGLGSGE